MIETDLTREECAEAGRIYFPAGLPGFPHLRMTSNLLSPSQASSV